MSSPTENNDKVKIYLLPNLLTAGNLFCGYGAVMKVLSGNLAYHMADRFDLFHQAILLIIAAFLFDFFDGRLARLGGKESPFGREFDSLADVISFGMAPALLVSSIVLKDFPTLGWIVAFVYLACGAMRLARFNVLQNRDLKNFTGFPIPAAAGVTVSLTLLIMWLNERERELGMWKFAILGIMLLLSFMMISQVKYPSFKNLSMTAEKPFLTLVTIVIIIGLIAINYHVGLAIIFVTYLLYGLARPWVQRSIRKEIELDEEEPENESTAEPKG